MISSEEALRILQGWLAKQVKLSFSTGFSGNGVLSRVSSDAITFTSGGREVVIPVADATFRLVPRSEVKIASMRENWSQAIEIRLSSGAFALLLLLSGKPSPTTDEGAN